MELDTVAKEWPTKLPFRALDGTLHPESEEFMEQQDLKEQASVEESY